MSTELLPPDDTGRSPRKATSNRKNSLKSTGPRSQRGKRIASLNALKHGLFAKVAVIESGDGKEDRGRFEELLRTLLEYWEPDAGLEAMLVEKLAVDYWRLGRVYRCEIGEIRKRADTIRDDESIRRENEFATQLSLLCEDDNGLSMRRSLLGVQRLSNVLRLAQRDIETEGSISDWTTHLIRQHFGSEGEFSLRLLNMQDNALQCAAEAGENDPKALRMSKADQQELLEQIDDELRDLKVLQNKFNRKELLSVESEAAACSLPPMLETDRILRYRAAIQREIDRGIDQLERLQRSRKGEYVPPPVKISVAAER